MRGYAGLQLEATGSKYGDSGRSDRIIRDEIGRSY